MDFKLYSDRALTKEVTDPIDLGKLKAGETKVYEFYVFNNAVYPYEEMQFAIDDEEVMIISHPKELNEKASDVLVIEWSPSEDVEKGLKAKLEITGYKVVGG